MMDTTDQTSHIRGLGTLSADELRYYLFEADGSQRLLVSPLIEREITTGTLDIHLGTSFILTRRNRYASVDPLTLTSEAVKRWQEKLRIRFGEDFTLHPGQLVLAGTLEYVCVPYELAASVVTRSSYGRLGLISATAIHVHSGFRGCITLELYNFGDTPIVLYPALPIAQLVFSRVSGKGPPFRSKYALSVGPEFPKIWEDDSRSVLLRMKKHFTGSGH